MPTSLLPLTAIEHIATIDQDRILHELAHR